MDSSYCREIARDNLRGRWGIAILAALIAPAASMFSVSYDFSGSETSQSASINLPPEFALIITPLSLALCFIGILLSVGFARFHMDIYDSPAKPRLRTLFSSFYNWKTVLLTFLLQLLRVGLRMLLFIVPGIIAMFNYAMVPYILAEKPYLSSGDILDASKDMMRGNRLEFLVLQLSFLGWVLLPLPIAFLIFLFVPNPVSGILMGLLLLPYSLFLETYTQAANAAFYRRISGTYLRYDTPRETTAPDNPQ